MGRLKLEMIMATNPARKSDGVPSPADDAELDSIVTYPHLVVRIYSAVYQRERIDVRVGAWPVAQIGHRCSFVLHPAPFNRDGAISPACRKFLINSVQEAVDRLKRQMCVIWAPSLCTFVQ